MVLWKLLELKAREIRPSSMSRAAPIRPKESTTNHRRQLKTARDSPRFVKRKMLTGFFSPAMVVTQP